MATTKATTLAHTLGGISSDISTAEINRLDGVTGDLQTQLDAKLATATAASTYAPLASPQFTGDVTLGATTKLKLGSSGGIYESDGSTAILNESSGSVSLSNSHIGDSNTFPDYTPIKVQTFKYGMSGADGLHQNSTANWTVCTRTSSGDASAQHFTHKSGYTYFFNYRWYGETLCDDSATTNRHGYWKLVCDSTDKNWNDTGNNSAAIARLDAGRLITSSSSASAPSLLSLGLHGAKYFSSAGTEYVYLISYAPSNVNAKTYQRNDYPMYLTITEIKGNFSNNT